MSTCTLRNVASNLYVHVYLDDKAHPRIQLVGMPPIADSWVRHSTHERNGVRFQHVGTEYFLGSQPMRPSNHVLEPCVKQIPSLFSSDTSTDTLWNDLPTKDATIFHLQHLKTNLFLRVHTYAYDGIPRLEMVSDKTDPETLWEIVEEVEQEQTNVTLPLKDANIYYQDPVIAWFMVFLFMVMVAFAKQYEMTLAK